MTLENNIQQVIEAPLRSMGFDVVRLRLQNRSSGAYNLKVLEILIERTDGVHISITDCKNASNHISAILDIEDIIDGKYNLEVSSAGIERPLVKLQDFDRFKNYVAEIKLHNALNGSKKYECTIIGIDGNAVQVSIRKDKVVVSIDFENIKDAKLVLTDELYRKIVKD
jgi:ribosome maturation factor RimP